MNFSQVLKFILEGNRLPIPENCPPEVYILMNWCWQHTARDRPTFKEIHDELVRLRILYLQAQADATHSSTKYDTPITGESSMYENLKTVTEVSSA